MFWYPQGLFTPVQGLIYLSQGVHIMHVGLLLETTFLPEKDIFLL
jgi:hypothetical protein